MHQQVEKKASLELLLGKNKLFIEKYKKNSLMQLVQSAQIENKKIRAQLLDGIQVISNYFQKVVMLRNIFCEKSLFLNLTEEHLLEEFGHNLTLRKDRNYRVAIWDPIIEASSSWFAWKMFTLDDEEKTVLIHLVLEASGNVFLHEAHKNLSKYKETEYFKIHAEVDDKHENMGKEALHDLSEKKYERLLTILSQGWDMINLCCEQIAKRSVQSAEN